MLVIAPSERSYIINCKSVSGLTSANVVVMGSYAPSIWQTPMRLKPSMVIFDCYRVSMQLDVLSICMLCKLSTQIRLWRRAVFSPPHQNHVTRIR